MMIELIIIGVSILTLIVIYTGRVTSPTGDTRLFSNPFLTKMDEGIFEFIKFFFKLYSLVMSNFTSFLKKIPHRAIHTIHAVSHSLAAKSSKWVDKITRKTHTK
jgi:hypothetical protein